MSRNFLKALSPDTNKSGRLYLIDALRGCCVIGMVLYHTLFDAAYFFGFDLSRGALTAVSLVRDLGAAVFILLSGFAFRLGSHHARHVIALNVLGLIVTAATYIAARDMTVIFGILTFMGCACLIMCALSRPFSRLPALPSAVVCFILFFVFLSVNYGFCGYGKLVLFTFPGNLYKNMLTAFFGFPYPGFVSGDYFALLPWIFAYFFGFFLYGPVSENEKAVALLKRKIRFLSPLGKYSLYIYLVHQPLIYGAVYILSRLFA